MSHNMENWLGASIIGGIMGIGAVAVGQHVLGLSLGVGLTVFFHGLLEMASEA